MEEFYLEDEEEMKLFRVKGSVDFKIGDKIKGQTNTQATRQTGFYPDIDFIYESYQNGHY